MLLFGESRKSKAKILKVSDLVRPKIATARALGLFDVYGIITDIYEDDFGTVYCEVIWEHERMWLQPHELEILGEVEKN